MPDEEVRVGYCGGLILTSEMIRAQRFQMEMEQHYRDEQDKHETLMLLMKLQSSQIGNNPLPIFLIPIILIAMMAIFLRFA